MATTNRATAAKSTATSGRPVAAKKKTSGQAKPAAKRAPAAQDAIQILRADHLLVSRLFAEYQNARAISRKKALVAQICTELTVHAQGEEEIFYPAVKTALRDKVLVPEATVEHATLKDLISQIEGHEPEGEMFNAKMQVLSEYVKHHVKEEQGEMFPKAKSSKLDLAELGTRILARKAELKPAMAAKSVHPGILASIKDAIGITP
jgi:hemerythrin superfamily protein